MYRLMCVANNENEVYKRFGFDKFIYFIAIRLNSVPVKDKTNSLSLSVASRTDTK